MQPHRRTMRNSIGIAAIVIVAVMCLSSFAQTGDFDCILPGSTPEANPNTLRAVVFGGDRFVAVGDSGTIMLSTDAISWARQTVPVEVALFDVTYGAGEFVAVGNSGCVLVSVDGTKWELSGFGTTNNFRKIAYGNSTFVALTADGNVLLRSSDARNWEVTATLSSSERFSGGLLCGNGVFVAAINIGTALSSEDGRSWTTTLGPFGADRGGLCIDGVYYMSAPGGLATSTTLTNWSFQSFSYITALTYGGGKFLMVNYPMPVGASVRVSEDGQVWSSPISLGNTFLGAAYGLDQFVVVGEAGVIATAKDPTLWTYRNPALCPIITTVTGNNITVGAGAGIFTSQDNIHFKAQNRNIGGTSLVFANSIFVVGGNGVFWSRDGIAWNQVATPCDGQEVWSLQNHDRTVAAVCQKIITSNDGTNWIVRVDNPGYLMGVFFAGDRWIAYGWNGVIWTSTDSTNWTDVSFPTEADLGPASFANGLYSIYGESSYRLPESAVVSNDGVHWIDPEKEGPILSAQWARDANETTLALAGKWNAVYQLESTTNLIDWSAFQTITNVAGVATIAVTNSNSPLFIRAASAH